MFWRKIKNPSLHSPRSCQIWRIHTSFPPPSARILKVPSPRLPDSSTSSGRRNPWRRDFTSSVERYLTSAPHPGHSAGRQPPRSRGARYVALVEQMGHSTSYPLYSSWILTPRGTALAKGPRDLRSLSRTPSGPLRSSPLASTSGGSASTTKAGDLSQSSLASCSSISGLALIHRSLQRFLIGDMMTKVLYSPLVLFSLIVVSLGKKLFTGSSCPSP